MLPNTVKAVPDTIMLGEAVNIQWLTTEMGVRDWICLVQHRSKTNKEPLLRHNTSGVTFGAASLRPTKAGRFDVRLVDKTGKTLINGNTLTVKPRTPGSERQARPRGSTWSNSNLTDEVKRSFFG